MRTVCIQKVAVFIIGFAVLTSYSKQWEVFTSKNDVQDIALAGNTLWAATTGGVVAWNLTDNSYVSYTTADGLSSCNINQVAVDNKGRPWVATKEPTGLCFYENDTWKQIKVGGDDSEIIDKFISGLEVDQFGNVWVYTKYSYGSYELEFKYLWRYDGQVWHKHNGVYGPLALDLKKNLIAVDSLFADLEPVLFKIASFNGSAFINIWSSSFDNWWYFNLAHIALDNKGNSWVSYYSERTGDTYGVACNNTVYTTLDGLADDNVRSITPDESGNVWCATDGGISKFTGTGWVSYDTTQGVASNLVYKILIGSDTTLYAATSKGISILKSNKWKTLKTIDEPLHNDYTDLVIDMRDAVILAGDDHFAKYIDLKWKFDFLEYVRVGDSLNNPNFRFYNIKSNDNTKSFIKSEEGTIYAIGYENDKNGCILNQETGGSTFVKAFSLTLEKPNRSMSPAVVCSGTDLCFWLKGLDGDLVLYNKQSTTIFPSSGFGAFGDITCMLLDRDGRSVWVGYNTYDNKQSVGIIHFDGNTVKKRITVDDGLASDEMTAIARDSSGNLWFASEGSQYQNGGVAVLRNTKLTTYLKDSDGNELGGCNALFVDKSGIVWTYADSGIARFDGSSWKLFKNKTISPDLPYTRDIYTSCFSQIVQDKSGTMWFGTESGGGHADGNGLLAYADNRWYQFTTRDGIPCNNIRRLAFDSKDNIWILTSNGIAVRKSGELVRNQSRRDLKKPRNKQIIQQHGNRFYVSSDKKPAVIRYTLYDLSGRTVLKQTIHNENFFVVPQNRVGSGVRILSITTEGADKSQKKYVLKMSDIK